MHVSFLLTLFVFNQPEKCFEKGNLIQVGVMQSEQICIYFKSKFKL